MIIISTFDRYGAMMIFPDRRVLRSTLRLYFSYTIVMFPVRYQLCARLVLSAMTTTTVMRRRPLQYARDDAGRGRRRQWRPSAIIVLSCRARTAVLYGGRGGRGVHAKAGRAVSSVYGVRTRVSERRARGVRVCLCTCACAFVRLLLARACAAVARAAVDGGARTTRGHDEKEKAKRRTGKKK